MRALCIIGLCISCVVSMVGCGKLGGARLNTPPTLDPHPPGGSGGSVPGQNIARSYLRYGEQEAPVFAARLPAIVSSIAPDRCQRILGILMSTFEPFEICPGLPIPDVIRRVDGTQPRLQGKAASTPGILGGCYGIMGQVWHNCECRNSCAPGGADVWACDCPDTPPGQLPPGVADGRGFPARVYIEAEGMFCGGPIPPPCTLGGLCDREACPLGCQPLCDLSGPVSIPPTPQ